MSESEKRNLIKKTVIDILLKFKIIEADYTGQITLHCHQGQCKELVKTERI